MKTKMSNYRNCFALAYVLLVAVIFCGCGEPAKQKENIISAKRIDIHWFDENGYSSEEEFTIITIAFINQIKNENTSSNRLHRCTNN